MYPCLKLDGQPMNLIDAPGVGEHGISPDDVAMIEEFVSEHVPNGIRAVVVTLRDARIELSNQTAQAIVDKGLPLPMVIGMQTSSFAEPRRL